MDTEDFDRAAAEEFNRAKADLARQSPMTAQVAFYRRLDAAIAAAAAQAASKTACEAGCSYCCYYKVEAKASEVLAVHQYVNERFSECQKQALLAQATANVAEVGGFTHKQHLSTNQKCPLLFDDRCSVYPVRPSKCRNFHATDVAGCKQSFDEPHNLSIPNSFVAEIAASANGVTHGFEIAQEKAAYDARVYDLSSALLECFSNPKAAKRLRGGKRTFVEARVVSLTSEGDF